MCDALEERREDHVHESYREGERNQKLIEGSLQFSPAACNQGRVSRRHVQFPCSGGQNLISVRHAESGSDGGLQRDLTLPVETIDLRNTPRRCEFDDIVETHKLSVSCWNIKAGNGIRIVTFPFRQPQFDIVVFVDGVVMKSGNPLVSADHQAYC